MCVWKQTISICVYQQKTRRSSRDRDNSSPPSVWSHSSCARKGLDGKLWTWLGGDVSLPALGCHTALLETCHFPQCQQNRSQPGTWLNAFIHFNLYSRASRVRHSFPSRSSVPLLEDRQINPIKQLDNCFDKVLFLVLWEAGGEAPGQSKMGRSDRKY